MYLHEWLNFYGFHVGKYKSPSHGWYRNCQMGEFDGKFHQVCLSSSKNQVTGEVGRCCTQQQAYQERNGKIMLNRRLVGGFNPFEKYARKMGNLRWKFQKYLSCQHLADLGIIQRTDMLPNVPSIATPRVPLAFCFFPWPPRPTHHVEKEINQSPPHIYRKRAPNRTDEINGCVPLSALLPVLSMACTLQRSRDHLNQMPSTNCSAPKTNTACYRSQSVSIPAGW